MAPELAVCILLRELPLDGLAQGVAVALPRVDFALQDLWHREAAIQTLAAEAAGVRADAVSQTPARTSPS